MNRIKGTISTITVDGKLSLVEVEAKELLFTTIVIDTPETASYLQVNREITLLFKETEVILATERNIPISLQNQLEGEIIALTKGKLLTKVQLRTVVGDISAIVTSRAVAQLALAIGVAAVALIKTNEIMLSN